MSSRKLAKEMIQSMKNPLDKMMKVPVSTPHLTHQYLGFKYRRFDRG